MHGGCGIPKVTLDGILEDWLRLQEKLDRLEPVVAQFIYTYKGNVEEDFW
ncbi:14226_t:CDS:2 [Funneliformis caledonium]|uniref:14226_t:CDS:1 n=1 Tax=Funneliformis caledonium TaxID=1117310 RepID=A0A9N8W7T0_9GLOM|nr:14226_t:CDS:2 [Funneliformis caledonium]